MRLLKKMHTLLYCMAFACIYSSIAFGDVSCPSGWTSVTEDDITSTIYSGAVPPPDMIIRTGGEIRLSNFLLWQSAYSELFFTDTLWPDLATEEVDRMIDTYYQRNRRYGGV